MGDFQCLEILTNSFNSESNTFGFNWNTQDMIFSKIENEPDLTKLLSK